MDPESKKLLEDTFHLAQDNNHMLHKIRRFQKFGIFWSGLKILLIIGIALGSFYFLEPYMNKVINAWDSIAGVQQQSNGTPIQDFLKKIGN